MGYVVSYLEEGEEDLGGGSGLAEVGLAEGGGYWGFGGWAYWEG